MVGVTVGDGVTLGVAVGAGVSAGAGVDVGVGACAKGLQATSMTNATSNEDGMRRWRVPEGIA